jgi:hypothetical protein
MINEQVNQPIKKVCSWLTDAGILVVLRLFLSFLFSVDGMGLGGDMTARDKRAKRGGGGEMR